MDHKAVVVGHTIKSIRLITFFHVAWFVLCAFHCALLQFAGNTGVRCIHGKFMWESLGAFPICCQWDVAMSTQNHLAAYFGAILLALIRTDQMQSSILTMIAHSCSSFLVASSARMHSYGNSRNVRIDCISLTSVRMMSEVYRMTSSLPWWRLHVTMLN